MDEPQTNEHRSFRRYQMKGTALVCKEAHYFGRHDVEDVSTGGARFHGGKRFWRVGDVLDVMLKLPNRGTIPLKAEIVRLQRVEGESTVAVAFLGPDRVMVMNALLGQVPRSPTQRLR